MNQTLPLFAALALGLLAAGCPSPSASGRGGGVGGGGGGGGSSGPWSVLGAAFPSATTNLTELRLQVGADGVPVAAYVDDARHLWVSRWSGDSWQLVGGGKVVDWTVEYVSLAIGTDGQPLVSFRNIGSPTGSGSVVLRRFNGTVWEPGWSDPIAEDLAITSSLIVLPGGDRVVAFDDQAHPTAMTVVRLGTSMTTLGVRGAVAGTSPHLAAAGSQVYLAHLDAEGKVAVRRYDGASGWTALGSPITTSGNRLTLAATAEGALYLAADLQGTAAPPSVFRWNGSAWVELGGGPAPVGKAGGFDLVATSGGPVLASSGLIVTPTTVRFPRNVLRYEGSWVDVGTPFDESFSARVVTLAQGTGGKLFVGALEGKPAVVRTLN